MKNGARFILLLLLLVGVMPVAAQSESLTLEPLGTYSTGFFDEGGAEIVSYHAGTQQLFIINGGDNTVDIISIADPAAPELVSQLDLSEYGDGPTSVAVYEDIIAVAVESGQGLGQVAFYTPDGAFVNAVEVGHLPDMVIFTPDGTKVLSANEGEPDDDYLDDPEGSVSIIDISSGVENATVTTLGFADFNLDGARAAELPAEARVYGPGASVAQDLEPEYIAVSADSATAYVSLQEANALAVIDITGASVTGIVALGFKDHSLEGNGLDVNNDDGAIRIQTYPVLGMYQPDTLVAFEVDGATYILSANEGDTRDYDGYSEEGDVAEATLDAETFPNAAELQSAEEAGNLEVMTPFSDTDEDGDVDVLYIPGGRSFSIWDTEGKLVWDSGDQIEQITAQLFPNDFNSDHAENNSFEDRSDNKGPEPEGAAIATLNDRLYAFIGLERIGGVLVYDITDPTAPEYTTYINTRDFSGDAEAGTAGDLGPEGLIVIAAEDSPTGEPLLVVGYEVSGTTTVYSISVNE